MLFLATDNYFGAWLCYEVLHYGEGQRGDAQLMLLPVAMYCTASDALLAYYSTQHPVIFHIFKKKLPIGSSGWIKPRETSHVGLLGLPQSRNSSLLFYNPGKQRPVNITCYWHDSRRFLTSSDCNVTHTNKVLSKVCVEFFWGLTKYVCGLISYKTPAVDSL